MPEHRRQDRAGGSRRNRKSNAASRGAAYRSSSSRRAAGGRPSIAHSATHASRGSDRTVGPAGGLGRQDQVRESRGKTLITRRRLLLGAGGIGAAAAIGVGVNAALNADSGSSAIETLSVSSGNVFTLDACTEMERESVFELDGTYDLPFGSLVFCNDDSLACCLLATEKASPLVKVATMDLSTGKTTTQLSEAVGSGDGFEIYDARATSSGMVWIEADVFAGTWRIYCASLNGTTLGSPTMLDSGDSSVQTPGIAAVGSRCFWTIMPPASAQNATKGSAQVKTSTFSQPSERTAYEGCSAASTGPATAWP